MRVIALLFLLATTSAFADVRVLDLKEIVRIALENNPKVKLARAELDQFDASKNLAKSNLYPTVSWNLNSTYLKDAVYTGSPKFGGDPYNTYASDLKLNQTLFAKGVFSSIRVADFDKKLQNVKVEIAERNLTQNIIGTFYKFIVSQLTLENLLRNQDIIQKSLATSQNRYNRGRGQLLDILQVKTQLALIQPQVEQARNQLLISGQQLLTDMSDSSITELKLKGELKTLLLKDVQAYIDTNNFYFPEYEFNKLQLSQLEQSREVTLGKNYPTLKLVGDYLYNNYKKSELFSDYSNAWAIQLQLSIPLFSGFSSNAERAILASQKSQLYITRNGLEQELSLRQVTSLKNLQTAETSLVSSESAVKIAESAQREADRLYKLSQIDFLQFLTVEQAALQAKTSLNQLKYQAILAYTDYFVSSGQPIGKLVDLLSKEGSK